MSVLQKVKQLLEPGDGSVEFNQYECDNCGETFESAKSPDRAQCMECLSTDVSRRD